MFTWLASEKCLRWISSGGGLNRQVCRFVEKLIAERVCKWLSGQMDSWMERWIAETWKVGWKYAQIGINEQKEDWGGRRVVKRCIVDGVCGWLNGQMDGWVGMLIVEWTDGCEWLSGQMGGWICVCGWVDRWMVEWTDGSMIAINSHFNGKVDSWVDAQLGVDKPIQREREEKGKL